MVNLAACAEKKFKATAAKENISVQALIDQEIIPQDSLNLEEIAGLELAGEQTVHSSVSRIPFFLIHAVCLAAFFLPFHWYWVALAVGMYYLRMFG